MLIVSFIKKSTLSLEYQYIFKFSTTNWLFQSILHNEIIESVNCYVNVFVLHHAVIFGFYKCIYM